MNQQKKELQTAIEITLVKLEEAAHKYRQRLYIGNQGDLTRAQTHLRRIQTALKDFEDKLAALTPQKLTTEAIATASFGDLEYWLEVVELATDYQPRENLEELAAWLAQRDEGLALGLLAWEIDGDGYYLAPTDLWLQVNDRWDNHHLEMIAKANAMVTPVVITIEAITDDEWLRDELDKTAPREDLTICSGCNRLVRECVCD